MRLQLTVLAVASAFALRANPASAQQAAAPAHSVTARAAVETTTYSDSDHVFVVTPVARAQLENPTAGWRVGGSYLIDTISAASVDIVSTASTHWRETRQAGALEAEYKPRDVGFRVSSAVSSEPDYLSFAGGGTVLLDLNQKNETLLFGYALDHDTIGRAGTPFSVFSRTLLTHTIDAGVTFTLSRSAALSLIGDVMIERGNQAKPYRYIPMFDAGVAKTIAAGEAINSVNAKRLPERPLERLPGARERYAVTARFGYRIKPFTLRADERLYADSWRLFASTSELRLYTELSRRTMLWPGLRVHAQNSVYFWRRAYVSGPASDGVLGVPQYRTGDRELGPLVTLGGGLGASFGLGPNEEPSRFKLIAQGDFAGTDFTDDLYVTSRLAGFVTVGVEGVFE